MHETRTRSLVKSIMWRLIGVFVLGLVTWLITHDVKTTTEVTIIFHVIRFILYYIHERVWDKINWGHTK